MAIGTIVGGVLGTLVNRACRTCWRAVVILVLIAVQSAAWWYWVQPLQPRPPGVPAISSQRHAIPRADRLDAG